MGDVEGRSLVSVLYGRAQPAGPVELSIIFVTGAEGDAAAPAQQLGAA
jgi:hypothetical protein